MGRPRPDVGSNVRSFAHGAYVVYYRCTVTRDRVEVLRVWHARHRTPRAADLPSVERISGKGDLTRQRTIITEAGDAGSSVIPAASSSVSR